MKKKFSHLIAHYLPQCLLLISILTSNVLFPATVIAQEIENTNNILQEETVPIDTSEDILEEGISTSIYEEEEVVEPLFVFENGTYTVNTVVEGEEYVYPDNNDVRVKFTEVTQEGNLVIKRVELTEEQKELLNTKDSYGWDITSSMSNGTFKYNLTLPNTQGNNDIEVKYTEDNNTYESIDNSNVEIKRNVVTIEGLDHFTVFVVSGVDNTGICTGASVTPPTGTTKCYTTIQRAVDAASEGDTIYVAEGTYYENITINKSLTIESINGATSTKIDGSLNPSEAVISISANSVTVRGFTIQNANSSYGVGGIYLVNSKNSVIKNNTFLNNVIDITIDEGSDRITVTENTLNGGYLGTSGWGISVYKASNNDISYNKITGIKSSSYGAIYLEYSDNNTISNNKLTNNLTLHGIQFQNSNYNNVLSNEIINNIYDSNDPGTYSGMGNGMGISLEYSTHNTLSGNTVKKQLNAIGLNHNSDYNIIEKNTLTENYNGILIITRDCIENTIQYNEIYNNKDSKNIGRGIYFLYNPEDNNSNVINFNSIYGNPTAGVFYEGSNILNATYNWWGDSSGPLALTNTTGKGNKVSNSVDYFPWYTDSSRTNLVTSLTQFVGSASYVRAGESNDISAQVKVPEPAEEVRFILNGDSNNPVAGYLHTQSGFSPLNGFEHWRLKTSLPAGQYTLTAQYRVGSTWYDVVGSSLAYSIDEPWAEWVYPSPEQYFRSSDNPLRIKADDQYFQFKKVVFNVNGTDYTVERNSCDLRSAGNYVLCDIKTASNWIGLTEGTYRTYSHSFTSAEVKATTYTLANNRFDPTDFTESNPKTASRVFYIDGTRPVTSNFTIDNPSQYYSKFIVASVNASDNNSVNSVTFFITEPRSTDGVCDGNGTHIVSQTISSKDGDGKYRATLDTSSLNGIYCVNAQAEDTSNSHSIPIEKIQVVIDNIAPSAPTITYPSDGAYFNSTPILNDWSDVEDTSGIANYRIEYVYDDGHDFYGGPYRTSTESQRNHIPGTWEQGGVTIRVQAVDNAGNEGAWSDAVHYTYDETKPTTPTNLTFKTTTGDVLGCNISTNKYTIVANWEASLDYSPLTYEYRSYNPINGWIWNAGNIGNTTEREGAFTVGDGTYGFAVRAVDAAGNYSDWTSAELTGSCQITYDSIRPVVTLSSPEDNYFTNQTVVKQSWDTTATDVAYYQYRSCRNNPTNEDCIKIYNEDHLSGKTRSVHNNNIAFWWQVRGIDNAGNIGEWSEPRKITIDTIAPTVDITSHNEGDIVKGEITITGKVVDLNLSHYWFVITNSSGIKVAGPDTVYTSANPAQITLDWNTENLPDGEYTIKLEARDLADNKDSGSSVEWVKIVVDNTAPTTVLNDDLSGKYTNQPILIEGVSTDTNGINSVNIYYRLTDTTDWTFLTTIDNTSNDSPYNFTYEWIPTSDGTYDIKVSATDTVGNSENSPTIDAVTYDTAEPSAPTLISPTNNSVVNGSILTNTWSKVDDAVKYIYESYNDENATSPRFTDTYTTTSKSEYNVQNANIWWRVKSVDAAGNESQWSNLWKVTIDNDKPTTTLTSDPSGTYTNMPVSITGQSTDTNGIDSVNISYRLTGTTDWTFLTTIDNTSNDSPYNFTYEWKPTSDGTYDIKVSATDIAGNIEQSAYIYALTYDSTAPSITVFNIASDILNISANDLLSGTDKVEVKIDNGEWTLYTTDINLNTILNNTPGTYTIYVKVTDKAGNTTEGSTTYTIPEGSVLGATTTTKTTTKTNVSTYALGIGSVEDTLEQGEEILETTSIIEEPSVLGERCENKKKVSGNVYLDKNKDKEMNEKEEGIKDITLTIQYTDDQGNIKTEEEVNTDEKGYWETQLCSGKYNIIVKEDTLPKNIEVAEVLSLTVSDNEEETIFNIQALDTRNFWQKYWYLIVGGLAIIVIGYTSIKNRKKEEI